MGGCGRAQGIEELLEFLGGHVHAGAGDVALVLGVRQGGGGGQAGDSALGVGGLVQVLQ